MQSRGFIYQQGLKVQRQIRNGPVLRKQSILKSPLFICPFCNLYHVEERMCMQKRKCEHSRRPGGDAAIFLDCSPCIYSWVSHFNQDLSNSALTQLTVKILSLFSQSFLSLKKKKSLPGSTLKVTV